MEAPISCISLASGATCTVLLQPDRLDLARPTPLSKRTSQYRLPLEFLYPACLDYLSTPSASWLIDTRSLATCTSSMAQQVSERCTCRARGIILLADISTQRRKSRIRHVQGGHPSRPSQQEARREDHWCHGHRVAQPRSSTSRAFKCGCNFSNRSRIAPLSV